MFGDIQQFVSLKWGVHRHNSFGGTVFNFPAGPVDRSVGVDSNNNGEYRKGKNAYDGTCQPFVMPLAEYQNDPKKGLHFDLAKAGNCDAWPESE